MTTRVVGADEVSVAEPLLRSYPFKPLYYYRASSEEARWAYFKFSLETMLGRDGGFAIISERDGKIDGFVACERRPWDALVIGRPAAMLGPIVVSEAGSSSGERRRALLQAALAELRARGVQHVTARCEADDLSLLHLLEQSEFIMVDSIVHLAWDLRAAPPPPVQEPPRTVLRDHTVADAETLKAIARSALRADRFHNDPTVDQERAHEMYATWAENACKGLDDAVVVAELDGDIVGFMTAKILPQTGELLGTRVGKLWIGSLAPAARGLGLYGALAAYLINWLAERGVHIVEGGTQTRNIPALRSLCRRGFLPANSMSTLRRLL